ncbi:hypothetical protein Tco_1330133 [Tanacetum coccineum]
MTDTESPKEGVGRVLLERRVTKLHSWSVASFLPDDDHPSTTLTSHKGNTSRTINMKLNKSPRLKKPYPSSLPEQTFASATQHKSQVRKRSSRKKNFSANHKGRHKSINGEKSEQTEQVRLGTIVGMVRGHTSRKRPREKSEPLLDNEISFSSTPGHRLVDSPIILEALIEGFLVRMIYVVGGSSSEVMYEYCFRNLRAETMAKLKECRKLLLGFSCKISYPIGTINLNVTMGESERLRTIPMEFAVVKSYSPYNVILGRTGLTSLRAVASTIHSMIKFSIANGIATMTTKKKPSKNVGG